MNDVNSRLPDPLSKKRIVFFFLIITVGLLPTRVFSEIPRIQDLNIKSSDLARSIGDKRLILIHDSKSDEKLDQPVRYVSALTVIDQPASHVRETVLNFSKYDDRIPYYQSVKQVEKSQERELVEFQFLLEMAVISPTVTYTLEFEEQEQDVLWKRHSGDILHDRGRWEFIPVSDSQTILSYTGWTDFSGLGWTVDTIMWAQPSLETAMPVTKAATIVDSFKEYFAGTKNTQPDTAENLPMDPRIPTFADQDDLPVNVLTQFSEMGTPMFIHTSEWIQSKDEEPLEFIFTTTYDVLNYPLSTSKKLTTRFDKTAELIPQAESVDVKNIQNGYRADWYFDLGFGILSVPVYYRVKYQWESPNILTYKRTKGDLEHIYGSLEWHPISDKRTLYFFSSASHIGEKAPTIVQMANIIPNRQIFMGVTLGAAGVEKAVKWANNQDTLPRSVREAKPIHSSDTDF